MTASLPTPARHVAFSWRRVAAIASNTLLELVRLKIFYFLVLFGILLSGSSLFMVKLTFQDQFQMLKDVCLGAMSIFTWLLAVLATAMLLPNDIEDRTLYTILAKPVPRFEYLLGKLLGVLALLFVAVALMSVVCVAVLALRQHTVLAETAQSMQGQPAADLEAALASIRASTFNVNLIAGIVSIYLKSALCAALTLFLSTMATSSIFTIIMSMMVYFIGHLQSIAREQWLDEQIPSALTRGFLMLVSLVFPDLQIFSLVDDIAAGTAVPAMLFVKMSALALTYISVYLALGYALFASREL